MFVSLVQKLSSATALVSTGMSVVTRPTTKSVLRPKRQLRGLLAVSLVMTAVSLGGQALARITKFDPKGSVDTVPYSINANGVVAGTYYLTENGYGHGFFRAPDGTITRFDVPKGKCGTYAQSINRRAAIAGGYGDSNCTEYGFIRAGNGTVRVLVFREQQVRKR